MRGQSLRLRLTSVHRQIGLYNELNDRVWDSLAHLMRAQREGEGAERLLREHEARIEDYLAGLE